MTGHLDVLLAPVLADAARSAVFAPVDLHLTDMLARRAGLDDPLAALAIALSVKAVRLDHVCFMLDDEGVSLLWRAEDNPAPGAPDPSALRAALLGAGHAVEVTDEGADVDAAGGAPLVLSGPRCYLRRYALLEQLVASRLREGSSLGAPPGAAQALRAGLGDADESQREAVARALSSAVSIIAGGPGTGKTTTVAHLLAVARSLPAPLRVALAAPTGKAASRLDDAVRRISGGAVEDVAAVTVHRLLGIGRDGISRTRRPLDADVVVIDEASMVSLPLLAAVLSRTRPDAHVVLVGDPDQLASIEVGAVLADVVDAASDPDSGVVVARLATSHRFSSSGEVASLAEAVREGSPAAFDEAVAASRGRLRRIEPVGRDEVVESVVDHAASVVAAGRRGDAGEALRLVGALGVLCATKRGDGSTSWWGAEIERRLLERGVLRAREADYAGRPLLVTRNDPLTGLNNGSLGVVVARDGAHVGAFDTGEFQLAALSATETAWALTIHKSQGSEYDDVVVSLPGPESPILTRELVYTAVTRSKGAVTLIAPPGSLEAALARRVARASGLAARLRRGS